MFYYRLFVRQRNAEPVNVALGVNTCVDSQVAACVHKCSHVHLGYLLPVAQPHSCSGHVLPQ